MHAPEDIFVSAIGYQLLEAEGRYYLYDTSTNAIIRVPAAVHAILADYFRLDLCELRSRHEASLGAGFNAAITFIEELIHESGMLAPFQRKDFSAILDRTILEQVFSSKLTGLILGVTEQCNLRCNYCIYSGHYSGERRHANRHMSWDVARQSIDFFMQRTNRDVETNIMLYGGEPFLCMDLIESCVKYLRSEFPERQPVQFNIATNGTLLDEKTIDFLANFDVGITISLDGPPSVHDSNRVFVNGSGSHACVMNNLRYLRSAYPQYLHRRVAVTATFDHNEDLLEVFDFLSSADLQDVNIRFNSVKTTDFEGYYVSQEQRTRHEKRIDELVEHHVRSVETSESFNHHLFESLFRDVFINIAGRNIGYAPIATHPNGTCIPGYNRMFVDAEGVFYPCEKFHIPEARIGDCHNGFDLDRIQALLGRMVDFCDEQCQSCWAYRLCSHCVMHFNDCGYISNARKRERCDTERKRFRRALERFVQLWEQEPQDAVNVPHSLHATVKTIQSARDAV